MSKFVFPTQQQQQQYVEDLDDGMPELEPITAIYNNDDEDSDSMPELDPIEDVDDDDDMPPLDEVEPEGTNNMRRGASQQHGAQSYWQGPNRNGPVVNGQGSNRNGPVVNVQGPNRTAPRQKYAPKQSPNYGDTACKEPMKQIVIHR